MCIQSMGAGQGSGIVMQRAFELGFEAAEESSRWGGLQEAEC